MTGFPPRWQSGCSPLCASRLPKSAEPTSVEGWTPKADGCSGSPTSAAPLIDLPRQRGGRMPRDLTRDFQRRRIALISGVARRTSLVQIRRFPVRDAQRGDLWRSLEFARGNGLRLGVTGLSRAGRDRIHHRAGAEPAARAAAARENERILPVFRVHAEGRMMRARLEPQPDDHAALRLRGSRRGADRRGPSLAGLDAPHFRTAPDHRIRARRGLAQRTFAPDDRHRRLSRRMAARPAAADQELCAMVARHAGGQRIGARARRSRPTWRAATLAAKPEAAASGDEAKKLAELFTDYLRAAPAETYALDAAAGRFLMPGDGRFARADLRAAARRRRRGHGGRLSPR